MVLTKNGGWIHLSPLTDLCGRMACLSFLSLLPGRDPLGSEGQGLRHAQGAMLAGGRWVHVACWVIWPMDGSVKGLLEHSHVCLHIVCVCLQAAELDGYGSDSITCKPNILMTQPFTEPVC